MTVVCRVLPVLVIPLLVGLLGAQAVDNDTGHSRRAVPSFGLGWVWTEPLPLPPRELVSRITGVSKEKLTDSIVDDIMAKYLKAASEEAASAPHLPSWTANIGGQYVGLDPAWIHLGPVKVPTFLLALLPLNVGFNPVAWERRRIRSEMMRDIQTAGRRSANLDEFEESVRQVRDRIASEREFKKNQRLPPPETGTPE